MSTLTKYLAYGPNDTLRRMAPKMFESLEPKYLYQYTSPDSREEVTVALYEQYEKKINATVSLVCIFECKDKKNRIELKKTGGRMGFRGSSLSEERGIEADVIDFIMDFSKRFGLSLQEEVSQPEEEEDQ